MFVLCPTRCLVQQQPSLPLLAYSRLGAFTKVAFVDIIRWNENNDNFMDKKLFGNMRREKKWHSQVDDDA